MPLLLHAVTLVRHDGDIWPSSLAHNLSLFDRLVVVDHQSVDGTGDITRRAVRAAAPIELLTYLQRTFLQGRIASFLARREFETSNCDWVFFLDGDEFIGADRAALERSLAWSASGVVRLSWRHLVPTTDWGRFESFDVGQPFHWSGRKLRFGKVAISRRFFARNPGFAVSVGYHRVAKDNGHRVQVLAPPSLRPPLLHLPMRSPERQRAKLAAFEDASTLGEYSGPTEHLRQLVRELELAPTGTAIDAILNYPQNVADSRALTLAEIAALPTLRLPRSARPLAHDVTMPSAPEVRERERAVIWNPPPKDVAAAMPRVEGDMLVLA